VDKTFHFEEILTVERPRLVRLCARLSGNREAAEDLAQEVMLTAWRHADRLREPEQHAPWLSSIARNVCLHWSRRHYRDQARLEQQGPTESADSLNNTLPDHFDLEVELERHELAMLLDRALGLLPAETRQALVQHYVEESPHAEIAAELGISEGAVALRLYRGKLALRRVLTSSLREEAAAYGIMGTPENSDAWEETRVWCPGCGRQKLLIRVARGVGTISFRCPACNPDPEVIDAEYRTGNTHFARLIGDLTRPKSILNKTATWISSYFASALEQGTAQCTNCGHHAQVRRYESGDALPGTVECHHVYVLCDACGEAVSSSFEGFVVSMPQVQRFWRKHSRIRALPNGEIEACGQIAHVMSFHSLTNSAQLDVVAAPDTFKLIGIHGDRDGVG
jgi:RNA polymerase sigma-70 factor (ECF subfamily)